MVARAVGRRAVQCLWRCYAADPRSQFSATWVVHVRGAGAGGSGSHAVAAAGHNIVRSFSRVARRASVSLVRLRRTSKNSGSPDAPSSSSVAAAAAAAERRAAGDETLLTDSDAAHAAGLPSLVHS